MIHSCFVRFLHEPPRQCHLGLRHRYIAAQPRRPSAWLFKALQTEINEPLVLFFVGLRQMRLVAKRGQLQ